MPIGSLSSKSLKHLCIINEIPKTIIPLKIIDKDGGSFAVRAGFLGARE
jgi:hypothetical protein